MSEIDTMFEESSVPEAKVIIESDSLTLPLNFHDFGILTGEIWKYLSIENIPYEIVLSNGSIELAVKLLEEISENPTVAAAMAALVAVITPKLLSMIKMAKRSKLKTNKSWKILEQLDSLVKKRKKDRLFSINLNYFKDGSTPNTILFIIVTFHNFRTGRLREFRVYEDKIEEI